jgi:hypothetical protein
MSITPVPRASIRPGNYKVVIRNFDTAITTDVQCTGRAYVLSIAGPAEQVEGVTLVNDDKDVTLSADAVQACEGKLLHASASTELVLLTMGKDFCGWQRQLAMR